MIMFQYDTYCQSDLIDWCFEPWGKENDQHWAEFRNSEKLKSCRMSFQISNLQFYLVTKPNLLILIQFLIQKGYKSGLQNIYTLPMSRVHFLGAIFVRNPNFDQIYPKIRLFLTPRISKFGWLWSTECPKSVKSIWLCFNMIHIVSLIWLIDVLNPWEKKMINIEQNSKILKNWTAIECLIQSAIFNFT